jgi:hypothetical protein
MINLRTGLTNPPTISVTAVANVQPAVMVVPSYVTLPPGPLGAAVTNSVSVRNQTTNELRLSDAVVNVPGVEAQIKEMQPGRLFTALVAFPQGFQVSPGQPVELSFKTSHPKFPVVKVPVMQMPRPAPPPPAPTAPPAPAAPPMKPVPPPTAKPPPKVPPPPLPPGL